MGPLHGVPVSLKDQFNVKGLDSTLGYVGRAFAPAETDAPLVQMLKQLGAVIIAKTNLPQSIMVRPLDSWLRAVDLVIAILTEPVVRNRQPALGFDHAPHRRKAHPRRLLRRRGSFAFSRRLPGRLGHRHWRLDTHPKPHERAVGVKTQREWWMASININDSIGSG